MRRLVQALSMAAGSLVALGGIASSLCLLLFPVASSEGASAFPSHTVAVAVGVFALGCGASLVWVGSCAIFDLPDRPFRMATWVWWLMAWLAILIAGQATLNGNGLLSLLPAFHLLAGVLAAFLFLAMAMGAARGSQRFVLGQSRAAIGSLAWGAVGGAGIAMLLEILLIAAMAVVVGFWLAATQPELAALLRNWMAEQLRNPGLTLDIQPLAGWLRSPPVALGALTLLCVVVPLVEETTKSVALPLVFLTGTRLTRLQSFLVGVAAGAGFAMLESILNGALGLANPREWAGLMLVRSGTAGLHCLASGLAGLSWQAILTERQPHGHWPLASWQWRYTAAGMQQRDSPP